MAARRYGCEYPDNSGDADRDDEVSGYVVGGGVPSPVGTPGFARSPGTGGLDPRTLLGRWSFDRTIDDRAAGDRKSVDGTLTLTAAATDSALDTESADASEARIRWFEEGILHLGDQDLPVTRTLFVEPRGDEWFVVFEDGHDFHPWTTGVQVEHPCGADMYRGRIDVAGPLGTGSEDTGSEDTDPERATAPRSWSVRWDVVGPAKDYTMTTRLRR